ncbi:sensor histidine kinase [Phaeobacter marinintestinus]|uniref:sensor histidine kinase n=1 Tax=Falsiphaeobacter marinintestinus TaxID=1492905 RepID=UPI001FE69AB1|nr:HAMP domain-containing sensor histidine kinase [Phaeobacter marinintestinus]
MNDPVLKSTTSLKFRLAIGAALLGAATVLTALMLFLGLGEVGRRLDTALASELRMSRYASLSTQAATFLVVATEAVQSGLPADVRTDRISPVVDQMRRTFVQLHDDVAQAVKAAETHGLDEQSRYGTQSLGVARMQALLDTTLRGLAVDTADKSRLRAHIDSFASGFDPLLGQAVNTEVMFRNTILAGIDTLRQRLAWLALLIAAATVPLVAAFYFGLVRPQFRRLDHLRAAAMQIGKADFAVALPVTHQDEIGLLAAETNRMAAALRDRQQKVAAEWARLTETIAERTEELRAANTALEEIDGNRRRFFADISHELRTPLTVILMEAQIGKKGPADTQDAFAIIEARALRLNRRVDDLLRLARSETGQLALETHPVGLPVLVAEVQSEIQAEIDNAGMILEVEDVPDIELQIDPNWVRQVVVSLIRNAVRHARDGKMVQLALATGEELAGLSITDNGPGIDPQDQSRIFDRFAQGSSKHRSQGFGVGLALARWVITEQGGRIAVTSPLSRSEAIGDAPGTKISVLLPVAQG